MMFGFLFLFLLACLWAVRGFRGTCALGRRVTQKASAKHISDGSNPFAFDAAFLEELSKSLGLSESAKKSIEERRFSYTLLSTIDKEDLLKVFPFDDALKIYTWSVVKAREEAKEAQRVAQAQEEAKKAPRVARESTDLRSKSSVIYCVTTKSFMIEAILKQRGQVEYQRSNPDWHPSGIAYMLRDESDMVEVLSNNGPPSDNGIGYIIFELTMIELDQLRQDLANASAVRAKADYGCILLISDHLGGKKFEFLGHNVKLTDPVTEN